MTDSELRNAILASFRDVPNERLRFTMSNILWLQKALPNRVRRKVLAGKALKEIDIRFRIQKSKL